VAPAIFLPPAASISPLIRTLHPPLTDPRVNRNREVEPVELRSHERILTGEDVWTTMQATAPFPVRPIALWVPPGFAPARLVDESFRGSPFRTTVVVLRMPPGQAVAGDFRAFLHRPRVGVSDDVVGFLAGADPSSSMLGEVGLAPWAVVIVGGWRWAPYGTLARVAGLRSIRGDTREAAALGRASPGRRFRTITVPMVLPFLIPAVPFLGTRNPDTFDLVMRLTGARARSRS
jgi:multiple sugar transport system permease protein